LRVLIFLFYFVLIVSSSIFFLFSLLFLILRTVASIYLSLLLLPFLLNLSASFACFDNVRWFTFTFGTDEGIAYNTMINISRIAFSCFCNNCFNCTRTHCTIKVVSRTIFTIIWNVINRMFFAKFVSMCTSIGVKDLTCIQHAIAFL